MLPHSRRPRGDICRFKQTAARNRKFRSSLFKGLQGVGQSPTKDRRALCKDSPVGCFERGEALQDKQRTKSLIWIAMLYATLLWRASPSAVPQLYARGIIPRVMTMPFISKNQNDRYLRAAKSH